MSRPHQCRAIAANPPVEAFRPRCSTPGDRGAVTLSLDEFEAVRLADLEGMYHVAGARQMGVSRATFGRILASARLKLAKVICLGQTLYISGGPVHVGQPHKCPCQMPVPPHCCRNLGPEPVTS